MTKNDMKTATTILIDVKKTIDIPVVIHSLKYSKMAEVSRRKLIRCRFATPKFQVGKQSLKV